MLLLVLIGVPVVEVLVFIEVGRTIGWLLTALLLIGSSVIGARLLPIQGRSAVERVSLAVSERRAPGRAALDGALGFLGAALLVVPGFVTDAIGALLLLPAPRALARSWLSLHYAGRMMSFVATAGRFVSGERGSRPPTSSRRRWTTTRTSSSANATRRPLTDGRSAARGLNLDRRHRRSWQNRRRRRRATD